MDAECRDDGCPNGGKMRRIVAGDDRHGGCVDAVLGVDFGGGTAGEEVGGDQFEEGLTEDFTEEHSRDTFFKHLEARVNAVFIDFIVVACVLQDVELSNQNCP